MSYYDEETGRVSNRQRDLVLSINEYCFVQSKTDGSIKTHVGPLTMTISQQESLVTFNSKTKRFEETQDFERAKQLFVSAPEGWYIVLKNPTSDGEHPSASKGNITPSNINIGKKVNIFGPTSFALYPGQMTRVIRGHRLRSNQYLLARVYDADAANSNNGVVADAEGNTKETKETYSPGQLLVIKGTEVSFYIPPTGIEVIPIGDYNGSDFVRDAVTLERLEYCILKNENGEKRYVHGPAVVFPEPTETFVSTKHGGHCFRAIELSNISGIYVKVIAEYEENGVKHPIGEELFITGKDQMIYYPRPEHAIINYDGKYMHHAIAIPAGEGRYVMNRETGEIKTIIGPKMFLPDPRKEVVVKRKLTRQQCELWFPGNYEVIQYNDELNEKAVEKSLRSTNCSNTLNYSSVSSAFSDKATMDLLETTAGISRGTSYTKPRTITLDTKYDGVVSIDIWTGYAINVVSKSKDRKVIVGPTTKLLDYDESLEVLELSTGKPKTTDNLLKTVYLRVENNKISDIIRVQTKDFVDIEIKVSYCVDFLKEHKDKWFSVENYVKYLCDRQRSLLKREAKKYDIEEFYANASDITRKVLLDIQENSGDEEVSKKQISRPGRFFKENGMLVHDVEVLSVKVERDIALILEAHQERMVNQTLKLSNAQKDMEVTKQLEEYEREKAELKYETLMKEKELKHKAELEAITKDAEIAEKHRVEELAEKQAESDMQKLLDAIATAEIARDRKYDDEKIKTEQALAELEKAKQEAYAKTVATIMESISDDLVAALESNANADVLKAISGSVSPYAMAKGESVPEVINTLLRGTSFEQTIKNIKETK